MWTAVFSNPSATDDGYVQKGIISGSNGIFFLSSFHYVVNKNTRPDKKWSREEKQHVGNAPFDLRQWLARLNLVFLPPRHSDVNVAFSSTPPFWSLGIFCLPTVCGIFGGLIIKTLGSRCCACFVENVCLVARANTVPLYWPRELGQDAALDDGAQKHDDDILSSWWLLIVPNNICSIFHRAIWGSAALPVQVKPTNSCYIMNVLYRGIPSFKRWITYSCTFVRPLPDAGIIHSRGVSPAEVNKSSCTTCGMICFPSVWWIAGLYSTFLCTSPVLPLAATSDRDTGIWIFYRNPPTSSGESDLPVKCCKSGSATQCRCAVRSAWKSDTPPHWENRRGSGKQWHFNCNMSSSTLITAFDAPSLCPILFQQ